MLTLIALFLMLILLAWERQRTQQALNQLHMLDQKLELISAEIPEVKQEISVLRHTVQQLHDQLADQPTAAEMEKILTAAPANAKINRLAGDDLE